MMKYVLSGAETERLRFRLLEDRDFEPWKELFHSNDAIRFLGLNAEKSPEELCKFWFEKINKRYKEDRGGMNVLVDKSTGKMVGQCGLLIQEIEGEQVLEIGYSILPAYRGMGFATEAAIACKNEAFRQNLAIDLISMVHHDNHGSAAVAKKNGMKNLRSIADYEGMPVYIFGISKQEWEQSQK